MKNYGSWVITNKERVRIPLSPPGNEWSVGAGSFTTYSECEDARAAYSSWAYRSVCSETRLY